MPKFPLVSNFAKSVPFLPNRSVEPRIIPSASPLSVAVRNSSSGEPAVPSFLKIICRLLLVNFELPSVSICRAAADGLNNANVSPLPGLRFTALLAVSITSSAVSAELLTLIKSAPDVAASWISNFALGVDVPIPTSLGTPLNRLSIVIFLFLLAAAASLISTTVTKSSIA